MGRIAAAVLATILLGACGPDPADPKSPEHLLLDHAIAALWGKVAPASVHGLRTRSVLVEKNDGFSSSFELETLLGPGGDYREKRVWKDYGLEEVFTATGERSWYLVDGALLLNEKEADEGPGRDQGWLFEVSKLVDLKDGARFQLKHQGVQTLDDGREAERLLVRDRERPGLELALDIARDDWLVRRVILIDDRGKHTFTLLLDDYRPVGGVLFAHSIVSRLDGKHFARQEVREIEINPDLDPGLFAPPEAEVPLKVVHKDCIGGWLAWRRLEDEQAARELPALKDWITAQGLEVAGPLLVLGGDPSAARANERGTRLALAIKPPSAEQLGRIPPGEDFGLVELRPRPALCVTAVGPERLAEARTSLEAALAAEGLKGALPPVEIYYSRDGRVRQLQLPLE